VERLIGPARPCVAGARDIPAGEVERYYQHGWWCGRTQLDEFLEWSRTDPERLAVVTYSAACGRLSHTYGELEDLSARVGGALVSLGVGEGDFVSVQLPNTWEFVAVVYGALRVGAIVNPLLPVLRERELGFVLGRIGSRVLIVPREFRGHDYEDMAHRLDNPATSPRTVVVVGEPSDARSVPFDDLLKAVHVDRVLAPKRPKADDVVEVQFTSGTTGEPKGVIHSYNTIRSGTSVIDAVYGLDSSDVCLMGSTLAHQTGFAYGMLKPLASGMTVVYQDVWNPDLALEIIESELVTWTLAATAFAVDLIAAQRERRRDVTSFRYFVCGGAPIPPKVVEDTAAVLGAQLVAVWGMTENMIVTTTRPGDPIELVSDSDGRPVEWMQIRIVDDLDREVSPGEAGNLQVRGPSQALGYFARPDLYEAATREGGWFDTGDLARRRGDGGVRIVGRTKDLVIRGGENIPVAEVEALLLRHPSIRDVAVVASPDDRLGERACAVVVTNRAVDLADLALFLQSHGMAKQFLPERLLRVESLPRTESGKIQKYKLRDVVLQAAADGKLERR
jgi:cyclohexanecarboxylate-CoA ligase